MHFLYRLLLKPLNRLLGESGTLPKAKNLLRLLCCHMGLKEKELPRYDCIQGSCVKCKDRMRTFEILLRDIDVNQLVTWTHWEKNEDGKVEPVLKAGTVR